MNCNPSSLQLKWGREDYEAGDLWGVIQFSSTDKRDYSASLVRDSQRRRRDWQIPFPSFSEKNKFGLNTITSLPHTRLSEGRGKPEIELKSTWRRCWRDLTRSSQKPASCVVVEPSPLRQIIVHWVRLKIQQWRPTRSHEADLLRQWMPIFWSIWAMLSEHSKTAWWWWWSPTSSSASQKILHFGQSNHPCHSSCCV